MNVAIQTVEDIAADIERRVAERQRIALPANLETKAGIRFVQLQNVSATGAMIEAANLPRVGTRVFVRCGELRASAVVVWAGSGRCGMEFADPREGERMLHLREQGLSNPQ